MRVINQSNETHSIDPELKRAVRQQYNFWIWLITPESRRGGRQRWMNWLLLVHLCVGATLATLFRGDLADGARSVVLPMAGVLVGLTFAWSATAISIITSKEFRRLMEESKQGVRGTANYFQLAILVVIASTVLWAIAGLGPYPLMFGLSKQLANYLSATILFACSSLAITECWSAINLTRMALLGYNLVHEFDESQRSEESK